MSSVIHHYYVMDQIFSNNTMRIFLKIACLGSLIFLAKCNQRERKETAGLMDLGKKPQVHLTPEIHSRSHLFNSTSDIHYGLDISHYQGNLMQEIDLRDSIKFIICKATQGDRYVDNHFRNNWRKIKDKGFIRGTYHFYVCADGPVKQAEHFAANIQDMEKTDIAPILDIEQGSLSKDIDNETMQKDLIQFLKRLEKLLNRKPIIYTDYAFAQEYLKDSTFADYPLWLAEYTKRDKPRIPDLWKTAGFLMWQRSDSYSAYSKQIDLDVSYGSVKNLIK